MTLKTGHVGQPFIVRILTITLVLLGGTAATTSLAQETPAKEIMLDLGGGLMLEMVLIHPGHFMMGSEKGEVYDGPVRSARIQKPFYIGKYEVTQAQWKA